MAFGASAEIWGRDLVDDVRCDLAEIANTSAQYEPVTMLVRDRDNGWGEKQDYDRDAEIARFVAEQAEVARLTTELILEGGCIEVDGDGTAIITESCTLNDNRIGFYVCNDAVLLQEFGDADADAKAKLESLFPDRAIEQLAVDAIAAGGDSIHCTTQQKPRV